MICSCMSIKSMIVKVEKTHDRYEEVITNELTHSIELSYCATAHKGICTICIEDVSVYSLMIVLRKNFKTYNYKVANDSIYYIKICMQLTMDVWERWIID